MGCRRSLCRDEGRRHGRRYSLPWHGLSLLGLQRALRLLSRNRDWDRRSLGIHSKSMKLALASVLGRHKHRFMREDNGVGWLWRRFRRLLRLGVASL